jgi:hypothetical protein
MISRCTDETADPTREASSVMVHSLSGWSRTSVSTSACSRDRNSGSNGGGADFCISRTIHCTIRKSNVGAPQSRSASSPRCSPAGGALPIVRPCRTRSGLPGSPSGSPSGSASGNSLVGGGPAADLLRGTQKVTASAKNCSDLQERAEPTGKSRERRESATQLTQCYKPLTWGNVLVELRGFEPLTFCMPCSTVSSDGVVLGPVSAVQQA